MLLVVLAMGLLSACGSGDEGAADATSTQFVALPTATPTPTVVPVDTATQPPATETATTAPAATQEAEPAPQESHEGQSWQDEDDTSSEPPAPAGPPDSGRWIDVNVSSYTVSLMDGSAPVQVIGPIAVGEAVDTGAYLSTQTGLFHVYSMNAALTYDPPYDTYISDWVGFDPGLDNGFHSFLKDEDGNIVDASTGNVSNGCIRTPDPEAIYNYATIGMPVYVHY